MERKDKLREGELDALKTFSKFWHDAAKLGLLNHLNHIQRCNIRFIFLWAYDFGYKDATLKRLEEELSIREDMTCYLDNIICINSILIQIARNIKKNEQQDKNQTIK